MKAIDQIAIKLAERSSRRDITKAASLAAAGAVGISHSRISFAQEATPAPETDGAEFLFVQTATSGSLAANPGAGTPTADGGSGADYVLTLEGHTGQTIFFSDRPERVTGVAPTDKFLDGLGFTPVNPPNAALVVENENGESNVVLVELLDPDYDDNADTIMYGVTPVDDYDETGLGFLATQVTDGEISETFGAASLFIDDCPDIKECYSTVMRGIPVPVGKIPGGPYGRCWDWKKFSCGPCHKSAPSGDKLDRKCNDHYAPDCGDNNCIAGP